jgi:hypothetical protein
MSQFRVEKRRAEAELVLSTGESLRGSFFLANSTAHHGGPERVLDLLNSESGCFPFETSEYEDTILVNRAHLVSAKLLTTTEEARLDSGYDVATVRRIVMRLSTRTFLRGTVRVYKPEGRDRLSDYARSPELFRYVENADGTFIVNSAHIVDVAEIPA